MIGSRSKLDGFNAGIWFIFGEINCNVEEARFMPASNNFNTLETKVCQISHVVGAPEAHLWNCYSNTRKLYGNVMYKVYGTNI